MKRIAKSTKALSPVVASIILIAVTVAVSIAVAVWMGALTTGFMATEQATITSAVFNSDNTVTLSVSNTGASSITINQAWIGTSQVTPTYGGDFSTAGALAGNAQGSMNVTLNPTSGYTYVFKIVSAKGNAFTYTAIAP